LIEEDQDNPYNRLILINSFEKWSAQFTDTIPSLFFIEAPDNDEQFVEKHKTDLKDLLSKVSFEEWPFADAKDYFEKVATHDKTLSRFCLAKCLEALKAKTKNGSGLLVSLSHTQHKSAFCAVTTPSQKILALGVDLELKDRVISEAAIERIKQNALSSASKNMDPLKLWIAKEAAFKAINRLSKKSPTPVTNVMQLDVESFNAETGEGLAMSKSASFRTPFKIVETKTSYLCLAYTLNEEAV